MNNNIAELVDAMSRLCSKQDASEQSGKENLVDLSENDMGARRLTLTCCSEPSTSAASRRIFRARYSKRTRKAIKKSLKKSQGITVEISGGNQSDLERLHTNLDRAETLYEMDDFQRTLELCNQNLEIDPEHGFTIFLKGCALHGLRRYDQACHLLQTALELCPARATKDIEKALRLCKAAYVRREYNISEFLLGRQPPPEVEEFIGDVKINKTRGGRDRGLGRGRGLFATKDISVGQLFLVSNAAVIVNRSVRPLKIDPSHEIKTSLQEDLVDAVLDASKKSQKLCQQLFQLDDGTTQVRSSFPAIDLFHTHCQERKEVRRELKEQRIRNIVSLNSFGGEYKKFTGEGPENAEPLGFTGLWLLPSFINHSCLPNATGLHVGKAMFLHAAKPIKKGEEITISYFDALLPQSRREKICGAWGFDRCMKCRRCGLERSLRTALESLNAQFESLHHDALQETNTAMSAGQDSPTELPKSAEFAQVFEKLEQILAKYTTMKEEEKNWVRASYVTAYWAGMQSDKLSSVDPILSRDKIILNAVVSTVPGEIRTLAMVDQMLQGLKHQIGNEGSAVKSFLEQATDVYVRVFGTHGEIFSGAKSTIL
ncbi:hypothetical protein SUGI_0493130 [Cryptomeria japonica]|uniref:uncharacterized protein LOC131045801 n=1 Tax=Cryptomeria japonica TaxID=3369 RepID=UPI002408E5B4|nr:uncharacterized protein LOC131045801 [Cryptomeria japonica]GLJ25755.1 hypothetical protein SUGI_0493130 [Cryptomeria japonica]